MSPVASVGLNGTADSETFFQSVAAVAPSHGVTRLADVTGLDRIGFPVWQAVRPAGRSLSVHQGKGATALAAKIGALCEAIECDKAEQVSPDGPCCRHDALVPLERAPDLADYGKDRRRPPAPESEISWCVATNLVTGGRHPLPHELVSLDMTRLGPSLFDRSSAGLALGATEADAIETALYEVIERDAVGEWDRSDRNQRLSCALAMDHIPFEWLHRWRERLDDLGMGLRVFALDAVDGLPCFIVSIDGKCEFGDGYRRFSGTAAHADPEVALFKALAEALQSRLTFIAGVRDDMLPSAYPGLRRQGSSRPLRHGNPRRRWTEIEPVAPGWEAAADRLVIRGYWRIVMKRLNRDREGFAVVKAFVPGLGSLTRTRRPPT